MNKILPIFILYFICSIHSTYAVNMNVVTNKDVVKLISGSITGTYLKLSDDMKRELPKHSPKGTDIRVIPMIGMGSWQNLVDIQFLKGVDIGLVQHDVMQAYKKIDPDIDKKVRYIAKLHDEEIHVLANKSIATLSDLMGKKIGIGNKGSGTAMTASNVLDAAGIQADHIHIGSNEALNKLRKGEIDAFFYVAGKPVNLFSEIKATEPFHFLPITHSNVKSKFKSVLLSSSDYPILISGNSVETVAVQAILAAFNFSKKKVRYKNVKTFAEALFSSQNELKKRGNGYHKKWNVIDLCEPVLGWTRYSAVLDTINTYCKKPSNSSYSLVCDSNNYGSMKKEELLECLQKQ